MGAVREELKSEKEKAAAIETKITLNSEKLCSYVSELVARDIQINQVEAEVKKSAETEIQKYSTRSCISRVLSGVHTVTLSNNGTFQGLCNLYIAGPEWIVTQQSIRAGVDFYRDWNTYRNGTFGDFWDWDFFLGLEKIHRLAERTLHSHD